jgi:hypothetical protein
LTFIFHGFAPENFLSLLVKLEAFLQVFCYVSKLRSFELVFLFDLESIQYDPEGPGRHAQLKEIVFAHREVYHDEND